MRDLLEKQIVEDAIAGDTTVLAELLTFVPDKYIKGALSECKYCGELCYLGEGCDEYNADGFGGLKTNTYI